LALESRCSWPSLLGRPGPLMPLELLAHRSEIQVNGALDRSVGGPNGRRPKDSIARIPEGVRVT
jgi:hypothetical protein